MHRFQSPDAERINQHFFCAEFQELHSQRFNAMHLLKEFNKLIFLVIARIFLMKFLKKNLNLKIVKF